MEIWNSRHNRLKMMWLVREILCIMKACEMFYNPSESVLQMLCLRMLVNLTNVLRMKRNAKRGYLICIIHIAGVSRCLISALLIFLQRGSYRLWKINMGVCPGLVFDNIIFINCLGYDFYIYGAFEFLCNSIANLWRHAWYYYNTLG